MHRSSESVRIFQDFPKRWKMLTSTYRNPAHYVSALCLSIFNLSPTQKTCFLPMVIKLTCLSVSAMWLLVAYSCIGTCKPSEHRAMFACNNVCACFFGHGRSCLESTHSSVRLESTYSVYCAVSAASAAPASCAAAAVPTASIA